MASQDPIPLDAKIFVAGHKGLVGGAIHRLLLSSGYTNVITRDRSQLDLTNESAVDAFFASEKPEYVFLAAAKVGGILANQTYPADFLLDNMKIQNAVITSSHQHGVKKLLFLGSSCIYPKFAKQPISEDELLSGSLEPTNEWYAIAKIAGIKLCQAFRQQYGFKAICAMPTNLYGPGDNFHPTNSHVLPALIRRVVEAKRDGLESITCWGTGSPRREFLHVDDLAMACLHLMKYYDSPELLNVGTGEDVTIKELVDMVKKAVGWDGKVIWDDSKPDGTPRKLLDVSKINAVGWKASIPLDKGIAETVEWYLKNESESRK